MKPSSKPDAVRRRRDVSRLPDWYIQIRLGLKADRCPAWLLRLKRAELMAKRALWKHTA
jgi:hypothetical protein